MHLLINPLLLSMLTCAVWGYNFDTSVPTIVDSGIGSRDGFGFSMTQHEFSDGRKVALVSAPSLDGSDRSGGPVEKEGGVFSCPFDNSQSCYIVPAFQTKNDSNPQAELFDSFLSGDNRSYEGELLGYSLRSLDNHVVACAPLYVGRIEPRNIDGEQHFLPTTNGRCVVLNKDLSAMEEDVLQITDNDLTGIAMRMGGVDTNIIKMDIGDGVMERIAIGSVHSGTNARGGNPPGQIIVTSINATTLGDADTTADTGETIELRPISEIASSAPRAHLHHGQIKIFNVPDDGDLSEQLTINGPQPDGYFGYDFVAHNFSDSGDYHSLIVGCPLCDEDRGAVFVYLHSGDRSAPFPSGPVPIPSPHSLVPGRFGMAVSVIGDSDGDGIADIAVSAPYVGGGVVYICRGFRGGILPPEQAIPASPISNAFGYTLSGGLDIDGNGYPDLSVGDLSGSVTTIRASPLVTVGIQLKDPPNTLDLEDDRKCRINDDITLLCFNVFPCFYYEPFHSVDIPQFAFQYTLTVDANRSSPRVVLLNKREGDLYTIITENSVADNITVTGAGMANRSCVGPFTFAIRADFAETTPILVHLAVSDSDSVPPLPADLATPTFGGPLTPVLRRYSEGDKLLDNELIHEIHFDLNCDGGVNTELCEPNYTITVTASFNDPLLLVPGVSFSYDVVINNTATDDGLSPILVLDLPNGILFDETVSTSMDAVTNCSGSSQVLCLLQNPLPSMSHLSLTISFTFNSSAIPLTTQSLDINFSVVDGSTDTSTVSSQQRVNVKAEASFDIGVLVSEEQYQATRHALTQNVQTIPLNETGPVVRLSVLASNSNGTTIPSSTIIIHIPVAIQPDRNADFRPLLIPYQILVESDNINCNYFDAIPDGLSVIQQPSNFIPPGTGLPPESSTLQECEGQRGELGVKCGVIVCSVRELEAGKPPSQLTIFAYLFSSSIIVRESFSISAEVSTTVAGLKANDTFSSGSFDLLPAVIEVPLDCFQYWIIAVSVVAGLLALIILIAALACCGVFGRWYKRKGDDDSSLGFSTETIDGSRPRTIPPLPVMKEVSGGDVEGEKGEEVREEEDTDEARRKAEEAEVERQLEEAASAQPTPITAGGEGIGRIDISLDQFNFDPHLGVAEEGDETEI